MVLLLRLSVFTQTRTVCDSTLSMSAPTTALNPLQTTSMTMLRTAGVTPSNGARWRMFLKCSHRISSTNKQTIICCGARWALGRVYCRIKTSVACKGDEEECQKHLLLIIFLVTTMGNLCGPHRNRVSPKPPDAVETPQSPLEKHLPKVSGDSDVVAGSFCRDGEQVVVEYFQVDSDESFSSVEQSDAGSTHRHEDQLEDLRERRRRRLVRLYIFFFPAPWQPCFLHLGPN